MLFIGYTYLGSKITRWKLKQCYIWSITLYGAETWSRRKVDQIQVYLESFEIWCRGRIEKIIWADLVKIE